MTSVDFQSHFTNLPAPDGPLTLSVSFRLTSQTVNAAIEGLSFARLIDRAIAEQTEGSRPVSELSYLAIGSTEGRLKEREGVVGWEWFHKLATVLTIVSVIGGPITARPNDPPDTTLVVIVDGHHGHGRRQPAGVYEVHVVNRQRQEPVLRIVVQ